jgi:predicted transcriptional regulator
MGLKNLKRSRESIISEILDICAEGACKTRIVYQANLNFRTVGPYLELLKTNGLIDTMQDSPRKYETTTRGLELLGYFKNIQLEFIK